MNCRDIEPLIYLVREGELTESEKAMVAEHLLICSHCENLARSVKTMTLEVLKADYDTIARTGDYQFTHQLLQRINRPARSLNFMLIKTAAACLLFLLTTTLIWQERNFYIHRSDFQARMQYDGSSMSDCLRELKRKIHYQSLASFARPDSIPVNLISEATITAYVRENCGYNPEDIKVLKKLLIQAGISN
jgi:hypothetical protein